ncbi:hypothetical protein M2165_004227 [Variovorax sp. TBS-050B]|uniref:rolling circle replication-associated protein n=1 Tax=Variovorax sp. TBS-050B TaxID=2940551 RepID=UPI0024749460|nr:hypothetical protein [Variovorax sp. TBS-050B]MDH6594338.1 hypothetical protein [Variovorax sp. TBS-050B]
MQRIVDGIAYEGKYIENAFDVRVWECNGHREISAQRVVEWREVGPAPDWSHLADEAKRAEWAELDEAERKEKNLRRAALRAKTACRRFIKSMGFDELATLTYRENQTDEALAKEHFSKWVRRMSDLIPGFAYCAGFEPQTRGAWHVHAAIYRLPQHVEMKKRMPGGEWRTFRVRGRDIGTVVWRGIVGKDNGLCFIGGKKKIRHSPAKMAGYVSKYITKHYELVPEGKKRYTHSEGVAVPKCVVERFVGLSLAELIGRCFWLDDGEDVVQHRVGRWKDSYYLSTELQPPGGDGPIGLAGESA